MNRREILFGLGASFIVPARAVAASFVPTRFSVQLRGGSGHDVILIPGLTASREVWRGTIAALPGYRYHLLQVAGFAGEPARGNVHGPILSPLAEELSRYVAAMDLRRPAVIGHSMGGTIAMLLAARHPAQVGRIMVVDMLPQPAGLLGSTADGLSALADSLGELATAPGGRELVSSVIEMFGNSSDSSARNDPDVVARIMQELARIDLTPQLPKIAAAMTVLYAASDPRRRGAIDAEYAAAYRLRKGTRLVRIDNSGHMIMYDQPARFRAEMAAFLKA